MILTEKFYRIHSSRDSEEKLALKKESFLEISLFKKIYDKYVNDGLPRKQELISFLQSEYKINTTYSPSVATTIIDSIQKYFKEYGINHSKNNSDDKKREIESDLKEFLVKKNTINIKINSPIGNFDLEATNKEEFEKVIKIINTIWHE